MFLQSIYNAESGKTIISFDLLESLFTISLKSAMLKVYH